MTGLMRAVAWLVCTLALAGCAQQSVRVLTPPTGNPPPVQTNPVTFMVEFHSRADVSTFKATLDPPLGSGATSDIDITSSFSQPFIPGGQSTAVIMVLQTPCSLLLAGCIDERRLRVEADMRPGEAFDSTGHDHRFRLYGSMTPPPPPPPSSPSVSMTVTPATASVVWGQTAAYIIELTGQNGFAGQVNLVVDQLPAGVTPTLSSNSVILTASGPPQTTTLSLATAFGASPPGATTFRVRATSSAPTVTQNPTLTIARMDGTFVRSSNLSAPTTQCGANVTATYGLNQTTNDIRVTFQVNRPTGPVSTQAIEALFYALSQDPDCRIGVVMHPCQNISCTGAGEPAISWYNLGWDPSTGAPPIPQRIENIVDINWHQFWFSADQSLLLLITKMQQAVSCVPNCPYLDVRAFVHDSITGNQLGQVDFRTRVLPMSSPSDPVADVTGASLTGSTVTINFVGQTGNADSRTVTIP